MEKIFEQNLLYDFYGELLTQHQQNIYEDAVYNDMSLSEIAQEQGISRQGVHDLIKRCDKILLGYESKLHLVERFMGAKEKIHEIEQLTKISEIGNDEDVAEKNRDTAVTTLGNDMQNQDITARMQRIRELAGELMQEW